MIIKTYHYYYFWQHSKTLVILLPTFSQQLQALAAQRERSRIALAVVTAKGANVYVNKSVNNCNTLITRGEKGINGFQKDKKIWKGGGEERRRKRGR